MARKFLYFFAFCVALFFAGRVVLSFYPEATTRMAFVPHSAFEAQAALAPKAYDAPGMWLSRPSKEKEPPQGLPPGEAGNDAARWNPPGATPPKAVEAAVFFVPPTTSFDRLHWNAPVDDAKSGLLAALVTRAYASPFAGASQIWAPRYRQAVLGAFLTDDPDAGKALDLAHGDLLQAFDAFLAAVPADMPIVLAGHSQGAYHVRRIMAERVAGTPLAARVAAVYAIGWGISPEHDLPRMGLPACTAPDEARCVISWLSFAEGGDPAMMFRAAARRRGLDGQSLDGARYLCSNPLTGKSGDSAPASANHGSLVLDAAFLAGEIKPGLTGAHCRADGALMLDGEPAMGPVVMPGNNYHAYDIPLFWANLREDYARRVAAWRKAH